MNAYVTQTDTVSGWLLVAGCGFVAAVWVVLANYPRLSDWWADLRAPAKADRIIATGATFAHTLDAGQAEYETAVFRESLSPAQSAALDAHTDAAQARLQMQADADLLAMPGFGLRIPGQRQAGDAS